MLVQTKNVSANEERRLHWFLTIIEQSMYLGRKYVQYDCALNGSHKWRYYTVHAVRKSLPFNNILIQVIRWVVAYTVWSPNKMKWEYVHG